MGLVTVRQAEGAMAAGAMDSDGPSQWAEWEGSLLSQGPGKQGEIEMLI